MNSVSSSSQIVH